MRAIAVQIELAWPGEQALVRIKTNRPRQTGGIAQFLREELWGGTDELERARMRVERHLR